MMLSLIHPNYTHHQHRLTEVHTTVPDISSTDLIQRISSLSRCSVYSVPFFTQTIHAMVHEVHQDNFYDYINNIAKDTRI